MIAVLFGAIYVIFTNPAHLPFTIGFNLDGTKAIALFGLLGTSIQGMIKWLIMRFRERK
jgi:hypothetical protein